MDEKGINIADAKKNFSELVGKVAFGKSRFLITKRGKPMARLVPVEEPETRLADVKGWLDNSDPFFDIIDSIVKNREEHIPRIFKQSGKK